LKQQPFPAALTVHRWDGRPEKQGRKGEKKRREKKKEREAASVNVLCSNRWSPSLAKRGERRRGKGGRETKEKGLYHSFNHSSILLKRGTWFGNGRNKKKIRNVPFHILFNPFHHPFVSFSCVELIGKWNEGKKNGE